MAQPDPITQAVQTQYETFPYPSLPDSLEIVAGSPIVDYSLAQYARTRTFQSSQGRRGLVAGCGTGSDLNVVSVTNPDFSDIIGVDLSAASIEIAQQRIERYNLRRCKAYQADLMQPDTLPDGPFDLIHSYGVLHHTADPTQALKNLADRLAPDGVMSLMLYNRAGRWVIYRVREALKILGIDSEPTTEAIEFVESLLTFAQPGTILGSHARAMAEYYTKKANIVDNFFHPQDIPFSIAELPAFLAAANLEFIDVSLQVEQKWSPTSAISMLHHDFHDRLKQLSRIEQLAVLEQLNPTAQTRNEFWCCHQGQFTAEPGFDAAFFNRSEWMVNPACLGAQVTYQSKARSLKEWCFDELPPMFDVMLRLKWSAVSTVQSHLTLSRFQLVDLLRPLAQQPMTGEALLARAGVTLDDHILSLFEMWENNFIVFRAR